MNQPDAQIAPNYVTCPCQHCGGKIEFDANQLDATEIPTVPCPHCELQTIIFVPDKKVPSVLAEEPLIKQNNQENRRSWETYEEMLAAAESGDPQAQCYLGVCFHNGMGGAKDYQEAVKWYRRSAEQGDPVGQCYLGVCYLTGAGVPQEYSEAAKWLREAAEQNDSAAQFNLGMLYETGQGVPQSSIESVKWYRESAEHGYAMAQFNLGVFYEAGHIVPQDYKEAARWYRAAAEQKCAPAQLNLGMCYQTGRGVEQDQKEAMKWFRMAAEQGDPIAQNNLGLAYSFGERDRAEAMKWFRMAAEQGNPDAQNSLGLAYWKGEGVPQNYVEAYKWANLAASTGLNEAKELRDTLAQQMTPSQIEEGQRLASREISKIQISTNHIVQERQTRAAITSEVRREVWRRDGGVCVKCGSRRNLEYDHIVPVSKGGSNTARNIELLCETCNRSKSASIQ